MPPPSPITSPLSERELVLVREADVPRFHDGWGMTFDQLVELMSK